MSLLGSPRDDDPERPTPDPQVEALPDVAHDPFPERVSGPAGAAALSEVRSDERRFPEQMARDVAANKAIRCWVATASISTDRVLGMRRPAASEDIPDAGGTRFKFVADASRQLSVNFSALSPRSDRPRQKQKGL